MTFFINFVLIYFSNKSPKSPPEGKKSGKQARVWELSGTNKDLAGLERTTDKPQETNFTPTDVKVQVWFCYSFIKPTHFLYILTDNWKNARRIKRF